MKKTYKYLLSLAVIFCFIAIIFSFSEQPGSESHNLSNTAAEKIIGTILSSGSSDKAPSEATIKSTAHLFDGPVRKLAHITIYLGLGFVATWLIWFNVNYDLHFKHLLLVIMLVFVVGCGDETIQYFSGGRGSSFKDVMIDTFGGMLGIYLHFIVRDFFVHILNGIKKASKKTDK